MHAGSPVGLWQRPGPVTLQHTLVRRAHTSSCSSGTQAHSEGSRRKAAVAARRDPAHATQAAADTAGEERDCYLFSPSSPGTSKPWPFVLRGAGSEGRAGRMDRGSGCLCWRQHRILRAARPVGQGACSAARPWRPESGACPGPGRCLKGCLPGLGGFAGAGHSLSSSASGCSCVSSARSGGKQAGRSSSGRRTMTKPSRIKGKEALLC